MIWIIPIALAALVLIREIHRKRRLSRAAYAEAQAYEQALKATRATLPQAPTPPRDVPWEVKSLILSGFNIATSEQRYPENLFTRFHLRDKQYSDRLLFERFRTRPNTKPLSGMNVTFEALDVRTQHEVIIKVFCFAETEYNRGRANMERFCLANGGPFAPELIAAYELDTKQHCLVMSKLPGASLETLLARSDFFGIHQQIELAKRLVRAVQYFHERLDIGLRDIKPPNILVECPGTGAALTINAVHLVDFDLATRHAFQKNTEKYFRGTPVYSAPEVITGKNVTPQLADQFALGATLFEMLVERYIAPIEDTVTTTQHIVEGRYLAEVQDSLRTAPHQGYAKVITRMLAHNPHDRYPSMAAVAVALQELSMHAP